MLHLYCDSVHLYFNYAPGSVRSYRDLLGWQTLLQGERDGARVTHVLARNKAAAKGYQGPFHSQLRSVEWAYGLVPFFSTSSRRQMTDSLLFQKKCSP